MVKTSGAEMPKKKRSIVNAAIMNKADLIQEILDDFPDSINDQQSDTGMTALHFACSHRSYKCFKVLAAAEGLDPWIRDVAGRYAMDLAMSSGHQQIIDELHYMMFEDDFDIEPDGPDNTPKTDAPKFNKK